MSKIEGYINKDDIRRRLKELEELRQNSYTYKNGRKVGNGMTWLYGKVIQELKTWLM